MRRLFIGGNWKSNNLLADSKKLVEIYNKIKFDPERLDIVAIPIEAQLAFVRSILNPQIQLGAQNFSSTAFGAYTGETTAEQILDCGAKWALIGHSERRTLYGESIEVTIKKLQRAMETDLKVIFCIGETLQERETGVTNKILASQLAGVKGAVKKWENLVLAYEPVWAIGTGKVATPEQAEDAHKFIREYIASVTDQTIADKLRIIYGGSVKSDNAVTLATKENIDGFLVGGASLKEDFLKISEALNTSA